MTNATVDLVVRLQALDGTWETCGADRAIGVNPESEQHSHNEWGADKASFDLHRSVIAIWPDLGAFTPVEVEIGGVVCWEGFIGETPERSAEWVINVQAKGWQYHLDDDVYLRTYVHSKLSDWNDARSFLTADLTKLHTNGSVQAGAGGIVIGYPKGAAVATTDHCAVILDLGPLATAKRVVMSFSNAGIGAASGYQIYVKVLADPSEMALGGNVIGPIDPSSGASPQAGTAGTPQRYVAVVLYREGVGVTEEADRLVKITGLSVFADTAYEAGNVSILKASQVIPDALERATLLLSEDFSQIAPTTFAIPDFTLSKASNPREAIEAANAYHNWITKILTGRRFQFKARPTDPLLEIGAWSGSNTEDQSANSGAEIYNLAMVEAQGPDGSPLLVERSASQQPGVLLVLAASPAADNPSFTTNSASWSASEGTFSRSTSESHSAPGCGLWEIASGVPSGATLTETFTGTFRKGVTYQVVIYASRVTIGADFEFDFGTGTDYAASVVTLVGGYQAVSIVWTPKEDASGVTLRIIYKKRSFSAELAVFRFDDLTLSSAQPTLVDRRGFRRTKVIQMSSAITPAEGNQIADVFLQGHMTTPFKGAVTVYPGGCRTVLGGQSTHPSQLGLHTQELVRLSHLIDPDTGGIGRDGTVAEVQYTHKDQKAQVTLDDKRGNFDALLSRLDVVQSVGS